MQIKILDISPKTFFSPSFPKLSVSTLGFFFLADENNVWIFRTLKLYFECQKSEGGTTQRKRVKTSVLQTFIFYILGECGLKSFDLLAFPSVRWQGFTHLVNAKTRRSLPMCNSNKNNVVNSTSNSNLLLQIEREAVILDAVILATQQELEQSKTDNSELLIESLGLAYANLRESVHSLRMEEIRRAA